MLLVKFLFLNQAFEAFNKFRLVLARLLNFHPKFKLIGINKINKPSAIIGVKYFISKFRIR